MSRQVVYYVATSLDQFIAREDATVEGFLTEGQHIPDYLKSLRDFDTVLMGSHTYEWGFQFGVRPGEPVGTYSHMMQYVFSQRLPLSDHAQLQIIREDAAAFVKQLKAQAGGDIYLCGGGKLAGYLLRHGLVDALILKVNPVVFGRGIPVFGEGVPSFELRLDATKAYSNGVVFLHYKIC